MPPIDGRQYDLKGNLVKAWTSGDYAASPRGLNRETQAEYEKITESYFDNKDGEWKHRIVGSGSNGHVEPSGRKDDQEKPRTDLLDPLALEGVAKVLAFGAKKYAAHNWRGGIAYSRLIGALLRHTFALLRGEDRDPESGLPHVDHIGCCWMFLSNMMKTRPDLDDRYRA